jgi:hypothetical protein
VLQYCLLHLHALPFLIDYVLESHYWYAVFLCRRRPYQLPTRKHIELFPEPRILTQDTLEEVIGILAHAGYGKSFLCYTL